MNALLDIPRIRASVAGQRVGRRISYVDATASTNELAWQTLDQLSAPQDTGPDKSASGGTCADGDASLDGLVVLAEHQTAGRGRFGRTWSDARGSSILCSVLLLDRDARLSGPWVSLATPVAVAEAVQRATGLLPTLKWPNDVHLQSRKCAGVLIERRRWRAGGAAWVVGVGINCLQHRGHFADVPGALATSLDIESSAPVHRSEVAIALLSSLESWLGAAQGRSEDALREAWLRCADMIGRPIRLRERGRIFAGSVIDLDPATGLVVQLDEGGVRAFAAAESSVVTDVQ